MPGLTPSSYQAAKLASLPCLLLALLASEAGAALPWLGVRAVDDRLSPASTRRFVLADEYGREVMLRGVNVENEERNLPNVTGQAQRSVNPADYVPGLCPNNTQLFQEPPICGVDAGSGKYAQSTAAASQNDLPQIRALGLNFIRLALSWSELEAQPGVYSTQYLDRVEQLVDWAEEQDVWVLLDLHEDDWSQFIVPSANDTGIPPFLTPSAGSDGAAAWATDSKGWPPLAVFGIGPLNLASMAAFQSFYDNAVVPGVPQGDAPGPGLQDHYVGAVAALARRFKDRSAVCGVEIMNEPEFGTTLNPFAFAGNFLYPFYRRVVQAVTGVRDGMPECVLPAYNTSDGSPCAYPDLGIRDTRHPFFFEPAATRNLLDFSPQVSVPFTNHSQLVYSPHVYTHVFTIDAEAPWLNLTDYPPSFDQAFDTARSEANAMGAAVLVTEFGCSRNDDQRLLVPTLDAQDRALTGASLWSWKSNCVGSWCADGAWVVYEPAAGNGTGPIPQNGPLDPARAALISRTHVRGAAGELLSAHFNTSTTAFVATCNASAPATGMPGGPPRFLRIAADEYGPAVSPRSLSANGSLTEVYIPPRVEWDVAVAGAGSLASLVTWPDGSRSAFVQPSGGIYSVAVGADAPSLAVGALLSPLGVQRSAAVLAGEEAARAVALAALRGWLDTDVRDAAALVGCELMT